MMKFKKITVDFRQVRDLQQIHEILAEAFLFPDFYGKNGHALIDCWSSLRFPEEGMTGITLGQDEVLLLEVKGVTRLGRLLMQFVAAVEAVNERAVKEMGQQPLIVLLPM